MSSIRRNSCAILQLPIALVNGAASVSMSAMQQCGKTVWDQGRQCFPSVEVSLGLTSLPASNFAVPTRSVEERIAPSPRQQVGRVY